MSTMFECSPRQIRKLVTEVLYAGLVPYVQSSPGMGKSSIIHSIAEELNLKVIDHRLSTSEPTDMSGLPHFVDGKACFAPFAELFPLGGQELPDKYDAEGKVIGKYDGWLLFLDEFNSATRAVQAACYKLILDRAVGQHKLHERCLIAAAGNLATDRAITNPLSTAMQSRVIHLQMRVDFNDWLYDVAIPNDYDSRVIAYLSQYPDRLMDFRPDHQDKTFCCPRTWEFTNKLIKDKVIDDNKDSLLAGTITSGVATDFIQFCDVYKSLITVDEICKDPINCRVPAQNEQGILWATVTHMTEKATKDNFKQLATYAARLDVTFRIIFFRSVLVRDPASRYYPEMTAAMGALQRHLRE